MVRGQQQKNPPLRLAVFASGTGSNFRAIVDSIEDGKLNAVVVGLISNNPDAGAIVFAESKQIPCEIVNKKRYPDESEHDAKILNILEQWKTNFIILAGYMKMINPLIVEKYKNRILNIHPALLPSFGGKGMYGLHVHEAVIEYGVKFSGVTVHIVNNEYDAGPVVLQRVVPVLDDDTPQSLQQRILKEEHIIYTEAIQLFAENRITVSGRRVFVQRDHAKN
ncbi:hypothetical protein AMJ80_05225 [bacterium SM23_31]|nr:MAG: hypothetical protein AMJ80_05225 [bacterium SM23_31]